MSKQEVKKQWNGKNSPNYREGQWKDKNGNWHPIMSKEKKNSDTPKRVSNFGGKPADGARSALEVDQQALCDSVTSTVKLFLEKYNKLHAKNVKLKNLLIDCENEEERLLVQQMQNHLFADIKMAHANLISDLVHTLVLER